MIWASDGSLILDPRTTCLANTTYCPCLYGVKIYTQNNEHLSCVELRIEYGSIAIGAKLLNSIRRIDTDGNTYLFYPLIRKIHCGISIADNTFYLSVRWEKGHSPYPSVNRMTVYAFGQKLIDDSPISKAPDDYTPICRVYRDYDDGTIYINGEPINEPREDDLQ